jgi:hypothetical protein
LNQLRDIQKEKKRAQSSTPTGAENPTADAKPTTPSKSIEDLFRQSQKVNKFLKRGGGQGGGQSHKSPPQA